MNGTMTQSILDELTADEALEVTGGGNLPPITPLKSEIPTWKYDKYGNTPAWAIAAAIAMGYEIEGV